MPSRETLQGCFAIFMACMALAPLGHVTTLANMMPYLASYLHEHTDATLDYSMVIWLSCALHAIQGVSTPLTTVLLPKVGFRPLLLVSCFIHNAGILLTGVTLRVNFGAVLFTYAVMVGWGIGAAYGLLLSVAASWFPQRRGLIVGICSCGFGAGAIILTPIQTFIINPQNIAIDNVTQMFRDEELLARVPKCLYILGGVMSVMQLIGCLLVRPRPEEEIDCHSDDVMDESNLRSLEISEKKTTYSDKETNMEPDMPPTKVMKHVDIYVFWLIMCLSIIPLTLIAATIKVVGQISIPDDKYLSLVSTFGAVFNTVSRIAWGPIGDRFSYKIPLCFLNSLYGVILITLPFIPPIPVAGKYLYGIWVTLVYFCVAGNFVMLPFGVSRAFGHKYFAGNYGIVFSAFTPGSVIGALIVFFVRLEHYLMEIFVACGLICLCNSIVALFLYDPNSTPFCRSISCSKNRKE